MGKLLHLELFVQFLCYAVNFCRKYFPSAFNMLSPPDLIFYRKFIGSRRRRRTTNEFICYYIRSHELCLAGVYNVVTKTMGKIKVECVKASKRQFLLAWTPFYTLIRIDLKWKCSNKACIFELFEVVTAEQRNRSTKYSSRPQQKLTWK